MRQRLSLNGQWSLTFFPEEQELARSPDALAVAAAPTIQAAVPGTVEQALLAAGLIEDPFVDRHCFDLRAFWLRKAPHMFGWDITPRIVSAGLGRATGYSRVARFRLCLRALRDRGVPARMTVYPGAGHGPTERVERDTAL